MKRLVLMMGLVAAAACGGAQDKPVKPVTPTKQTGAVLTLAPATLSAVVEGNPMELALSGDGAVTLNGKQVAAVSSSGEVRDQHGTVVVTVAADGRVSIPGAQEEITIQDDGTVLSKGKTVFSFDAEGVLTGELISSADAKLKFAGDPSARRAMMVVFLTTMAPAAEQAPPPPATTGP